MPLDQELGDELAFANSLPGAAGTQIDVQPEASAPCDDREIRRLADELGLSRYLHDAEALKAELQKLVLALHPDKNGGEFRSDQDKARFMRARRAVELLNARSNGEAGAVGALPGTPRAIASKGSDWVWRDNARHLQMNLTDQVRQRIARRFGPAKVGSGAAALALLLLALFAGSLEREAVLWPILGDAGVVWGLLAVAVASSALLAAGWLSERIVQARTEHLMSEASLAPIFEQACRCAKRAGRPDRLSGFDIRQAIEIVSRRRQPGRPLKGATWAFLRPDEATLADISTIQTQRLLDRRVIKTSNTPSLEMLYEVARP